MRKVLLRILAAFPHSPRPAIRTAPARLKLLKNKFAMACVPYPCAQSCAHVYIPFNPN